MLKFEVSCVILTGVLLVCPGLNAGGRRADKQPLGVGMVQLRPAPNRPFYFYAYPDYDKLPDKGAADSLTFFKGEHYVDIATAPPWFWPEVMKLDYNLLMLRAVTLARNWIEVIVNTQTGQTAWIDRHAVDFRDWPTFLLDVAAVEVAEPGRSAVHVRPFAHADSVATAVRQPLRPRAVQSNWLRVASGEPPGNQAALGWVQWHNEERLLITYSILE